MESSEFNIGSYVFNNDLQTYLSNLNYFTNTQPPYLQFHTLLLRLDGLEHDKQKLKYF